MRNAQRPGRGSWWARRRQRLAALLATPRARLISALLVVLLCLSGPGRNILGALLVFSGLGFLCFIVGWGIFHLRRILPVRDTVLRWSFAVTVVVTLFLSSSTAQSLARATGSLRAIPADLATLAMVLAAPAVFLVALVGSWTGATIGIWAARHTEKRSDAPSPRGVFLWWGSVLAAAIVSSLISDKWAQLLNPGVVFTPPLLTAALAYWRARRDDALGWTPHLLQGLARFLIWRGTWPRWFFRLGGRSFLWDARGPALGLLAAACMLLAGTTGLLAPLQMSAYLGTTRLCRGALESVRQLNDKGPDIPPPFRRDIVIVTWDSGPRYQALTRSSEAAVLARAVEKLRETGPRLIVLPRPRIAAVTTPPGKNGSVDIQINPDGVRAGATTGAPPDPARAVGDIPLPGVADFQRSRADLPELIRATRRAGNIILTAAPPDPDSGQTAPGGSAATALLALESAAQATATTVLQSYRVAPVLTVPLNKTDDKLSLPLLLRRRLDSPNAARGERLRPLDPVTPGGGVLVDFRGLADGPRIQHTTYGAVLRGEPLWHLAEQGGGAWQPPERFFRDGVVFLEPLTPSLRDTPLGVLSETETLAIATQTLLSRNALRRWNPLAAAVLTLLIGLLVGGICARRAPLDALWRTIMLIFAIVIGALVLFVVGYWLDPVVPLAAIAGAFLVVNQLTFTSDREIRDANRRLLSRFVSPDVIDRYADDPYGKLGLGGTRQQVCVLFADIRSFTPFTERHTPEEVVEAVNAYMGVLTEAVFVEHGHLDKYTGDGLMALFRVEDVTSDVCRAVRAALGMQQVAADISAQRVEQNKEPLAIGISLHYGEAVVGLVGSVARPDFTALGHTVVIAARLQSIAGGGEIIISDTVHAALDAGFCVEKSEPIQAKGIAEPIQAYRVLPAGASSPADRVEGMQPPDR